jgi:hypothetical protein
MIWLLLIHIAANNPAEIEDIRPPITSSPSLTIVVLLASLLLLAVIAYILWPNPKQAVIQPPLPKEIARRRLEEARAKIPTAGPYDFGVEVSDILRSFIEQQFGIKAVRQTTFEFLNEAAHTAFFDVARQEKLRRFLGACDAIKFAHTAPEQSNNQALFEQVSAFVEEVN